MRSFIATLLLFSLLLTLVIWNYHFINRTVNELIVKIDRLPQTPGGESEEALSEIAQRWADVKIYFSFSVSIVELNRVDSELTALTSRNAAQDENEYRYALAQFKLAIKNLARLEKFSVLNLL